MLILAGSCGWCCCCFWWWFFTGRGGWGEGDGGLDFGPGLARGPSPDPWRRWWPLANGLAGAAGGIAAWTVLGARFGGDGGFGSVALISVVGGLAATSLLNGLGALRKPRGGLVEPERPKG